MFTLPYVRGARSQRCSPVRIVRDDVGHIGGLAAQCGMGKSTTHHLLDTLVGTGDVARTGQLYCLGARLSLLAGQSADGYWQRLQRAFAPALHAFSDMTRQNCFLAVPGGTRADLTLAAFEGQLLRRLRRTEAIGASLENELVRVSAQGYALDIGASAPDLNCVALPLRVRGSVVAALSASGGATQPGPRQMRGAAARAMRELFNVLEL
ncbi:MULTISPECIES: IclR family transcriptional regulator C-terminal domain-containing protein [unclassified Achromobacter]|uniref:IclR family transcriptional regulator domain-containing protein n=1 Tax=unclassified Achromobacter TaxID=2626865 RepID=UPI000B51CC51|nr:MULTISPECIES: IclR family transcriptional regulator C-terminal domain-containing protein [unclassified Achromobacter]OWT77158.1 IclR family transcriptional regulator [Achromobacter sp. HZ28]OWT78039.1 IclR family transcriptional regulator [Achromobacter sp. HZ34]